jgi:hypothetical protein
MMDNEANYENVKREYHAAMGRLNSGMAQQAAQGLAGLNFPSPPKEATLSGALERFRLTTQSASQVRDELEQLVATLRPGPIGRNGMVGEPKSSAPSGLISDLHGAADTLGTLLSEIGSLVTRVKNLHG